LAELGFDVLILVRVDWIGGTKVWTAEGVLARLVVRRGTWPRMALSGKVVFQIIISMVAHCLRLEADAFR